MIRRLCALWVLLVLVGSAAPAQAQWMSEFFHSFPRDYKRNNCWPQPMLYADRAAVCAPFGPMVANGWRKQTLISAHHFEDDGKLSRAGEEKIWWILTQVPAQHRTLFVERGRTAAQTARRIDIVQQATAGMAGGGELPSVLETGIVAEGRPGQAVYDVLTRFPQSQPPPVLPAASSGGSESQ